MVVVTIIAISAALAIPSLIRITQDRRSQKSAMGVLGFLHEAKGRAAGRGAAMRVVWDPTTAAGGTLRLQEMLRDIDGNGSPDVPEGTCWTGGAAVTANQTRYWQRDQDWESVVVTLNTNAIPGPPVLLPAVTTLCFTPRGRLYQLVGLNFVQVNTLFSFRFQRAQAGVVLPVVPGVPERWVHLAPNGVARMTL